MLAEDSPQVAFVRKKFPNLVDGLEGVRQTGGFLQVSHLHLETLGGNLDGNNQLNEAFQ